MPGRLRENLDLIWFTTEQFRPDRCWAFIDNNGESGFRFAQTLRDRVLSLEELW